MSTSQNGWRVHQTSSGLTPLRWVTGRVVGGDVHTIFDYLCARFDREVENIVVGHSWGYAYRAIRGQSSGYSNHASGTAIDLNAPDHGLGVRGTFTARQVDAIHRILADLDGAVRWGGDYSGRVDPMHFEINAKKEWVAAVAARIRDGVDDMFEAEDSRRLKAVEKAVGRIAADIAKARKNTWKRDVALRQAMRARFNATDRDLDAIMAEVEGE